MHGNTRAWLLVGLLLLAACATPATEVAEIEPTPAQLATATPAPMPTDTPTLAATATATPAPTATATPTPARPTLTPTLLPLVTDNQQVALAPWARPLLDRLADLPGYEIQAYIDLASLTVTARQRVVYTNRYDGPLTEVYFNLYANAPRFGGSLEVSNLTVDGRPVEVLYERERRALRVPLATPLPPGRQVSFEMDFVVQVPSMAQSDLRPLVYSQQILSLGGWYPMLAVLDESGWRLDYHQEIIGEAMFADSAFYTVDLVAPADLVFAATGVEVDQAMQIHNDDEQRLWSFVSGPVRSFYAVGAPDYEVVGASLGDIAVRSYYRTGHEVCGKWALEAALAALELYAGLYGPYPFSEFNVVAADYALQAREFCGLIAIGEELYSADPACGEWFVAHETAHQWWYSAVGNDPVAHPWLDEALAQFSTMTYYRRLWGAGPAQAFIDAIIYDRFEPFADHPAGVHLDRPTTDFDTMSHYYAVVYARGAMFLDELNEQLGDDAFFASMQNYYRQNLFTIARPEDFYAALSASDPEAVEALWDEWVTAPEDD